MFDETTRPRPIALGLALVGIAVTLTLSACGGGSSGGNNGPAFSQPQIGVRAKTIITADNYEFRDANGNKQLDPYEDWRLSVDQRVDDLVSKMNLDEKAGMLLIDTLNAPSPSQTIANTNADRFVNTEKMTRFIFRNTVQLGSTTNVSPQQAAEFTNAVQQMAEATRLGIPVVFKSNARNHYDRSARAGINEPSGSFSEWPKEPGLAATRDLTLIEDFGRSIGQEWKSIGLRGAYAYMADLSTEPRWFRVHETFSEDADLNAQIMRSLVLGMQGGPVTPQTLVAMTIKHFPGGGSMRGGLDAHYTFGKQASYTAGQFANQIKPFQAAIDAGVSAIMAYYSVPVGLNYEGLAVPQVGYAFNKTALTDILKGKMGFKGYINSDTGIIAQRAWGLENASVNERVATSINAGTDVLSGFNSKQQILDVVNAGLVSQVRLDQAVKLLLREQFALGLFENPYIDATLANGIVGNESFRLKALNAQRKSLVLLKNDTATLPLRKPSAAAPVRLYTINLNSTVLSDAAYGGYTVVTGDRTTANGNTRAPVPANTDYVVIRVDVTNAANAYRSNDAATGANPAFINPSTGRTWGSDDPAGIDNSLTFGGAYPWEVNFLDFTRMASSASWRISPSLADIKDVMTEAAAINRKVVLSIYFRQPFVLDEVSGLKNVGAIVANFGVSDNALMDVLTGAFKPQGKLPFALANKPQAVETQDPDAPGYAAADTLYPFGFGLTF